MRTGKFVTKLLLALTLALPTLTNAAVILPALDIQSQTGDTGASLTATTFDIDATAIAIIFNGAPDQVIPDEIFTLTSTGTYSGNVGLAEGVFSGTFSVGSLLSGSFGNLEVDNLGAGFYSFSADVSYTGGDLAGSLLTGRIEGDFSDLLGTTAKVGQITVVPVPATIWLFGSGLIGLVAVSRRKQS